MRSSLQTIAVFAASIASLSVGNILMKLGMNRYGALTDGGMSSLQAIIKAPALPIGVALMLVQFIGTLTLFKWGWDASVVAPVMGLCFAGTAILGKWLLDEPVNAMRWLGIIMILVGVLCIARSAAAKEV